MAQFRFKQLHKDKNTRARVGEIHTEHGVIQTPAFVPVGTQATVKSLTPEELDTIGVQLYFVNTYHMYLRPGMEVIKKAGGLHKFMHWEKPLMTDSGGFQVFSLKPKITDEGVEFKSHWDGSKHIFTPEKSMEWQDTLRADIHIAFDECLANPSTHKQAEKSLSRTHDWAIRSLRSHRQGALYGSIQGGVFEDLRKDSAKFISSMSFDGIAIGGLSVGESKREMRDVLEWITPILPKEKPIHLLGVGEIDDIFMMIEQGIDTFDCVQPTRLARMGSLFNKHTTIDITKARYKNDFGPVEKGCACYTCKYYSRAYLNHLFHVKELLAYRLATIHNLHFIHRLVDDIRAAISEDRFLDLKADWL